MDVLPYLLKSAGVLALFHLVYLFLLRKETHYQSHRAFLLLGIVAALCFPLLQFTFTTSVVLPEYENFAIPSQADNFSALTSATHLLPNAPGSVSAENIFTFIYIAGFLVLWLKLIYQLTAVYLWLRKKSFQKLKGHRLIQDSTAGAPYSFFNYIVYNPKDYGKDELHMILAHERVHATQLHSMDVLLSHLLVAVQWYNPMAWHYQKCLLQNLEFIADHDALAQSANRKEYQFALLKAAVPMQTQSLANNFNNSFIKKRIIMINKTDSPRRNALKTFLILPLLALFFLGFNVREEIKYVESPIKKTNPVTTKPRQEEPKSIPNKNNILPAEVTTTQDPQPSISPVEKKEILEKYRVTIDKNTTDATLDKIKAEVKAQYGITLNYSAVRNPNNEIVSLAISFSGNGGNGNYQVTDDEGIDTFSFYVDDEGNPGFWSEAAEARRQERMDQRRDIMDERREIMKERRKAMNERQKAMHEKMEEREAQMKQRHNQMTHRRERLEDRAARMEQETRRMEMEQEEAGKPHPKYVHRAPKNSKKDDPLYFVNGQETTKDDVMEISAEEIDQVTVLKGKRALKKYGGKGVNGVVEITTKQ